jgi:hypothetical protein
MNQAHGTEDLLHPSRMLNLSIKDKFLFIRENKEHFHVTKLDKGERFS